MTQPPAHPTRPRADRIELPPNEVVTGEAVALELRPANVLRLIAAALVDIGVYGTLALALVMLGLRYLVANDSQATTWLITMIMVCLIAVPALVETLTRGRSVGRYALGYTIVREDGGPIRFRQALARSVVSVVEIWLTAGAFALICALINGRHKRLGDLLAGTYPLETANDPALAPPVIMPPELIDWAYRADVSRLPGTLAWNIREFLGRTATLDAGTRLTLARSLAAHVEPHVSPPPPWGTHPERFLAAVLVIRRDAEYRAGLRRLERRRTRLASVRRTSYGL